MELSADGIRIATANVPFAGSLLRVEIDLPSLRRGDSPEAAAPDEAGEKTLILHGEGRSSWSDRARGEFGAAMYFYPITQQYTNERTERAAWEEAAMKLQ